jgi:hypothetical protein
VNTSAFPGGETGIAPRVYYRDLLELAAWEGYGLIDEQLGAWLRAVAREELLLVSTILRAIRQECLAHGFEYQAEEALTLLGELHVAKRSFALFAALASEMGPRHWRRIERMAEAALRVGKRSLAIEVFAAADQPGWHRDYLRKRCKDLTGVLPAHGASRSPDTLG